MSLDEEWDAKIHDDSRVKVTEFKVKLRDQDDEEEKCSLGGNIHNNCGNINYPEINEGEWLSISKSIALQFNAIKYIARTLWGTTIKNLHRKEKESKDCWWSKWNFRNKERIHSVEDVRFPTRLVA